MTNHVIFVPGESFAIDYAQRSGDGGFVSAFSGDSLDRIRRVHPNAIVGTEDDFIEQQSRALTTAPRPVSAELYERVSDRGHNWQSSRASRRAHSGESFIVDDMLDGNVVSIYARLGNRHWRFEGVATLPHQEIMRRVALQEVDHECDD